jgi:hypothetical protein
VIHFLHAKKKIKLSAHLMSTLYGRNLKGIFNNKFLKLTTPERPVMCNNPIKLMRKLLIFSSNIWGIFSPSLQ